MTYDGSLSQPGCQETVTWIIINRPIIIDRQQVSAMSSMFTTKIKHNKQTSKNQNKTYKHTNDP